MAEITEEELIQGIKLARKYNDTATELTASKALLKLRESKQTQPTDEPVKYPEVPSMDESAKPAQEAPKEPGLLDGIRAEGARISAIEPNAGMQALPGIVEPLATMATGATSGLAGYLLGSGAGIVGEAEKRLKGEPVPPNYAEQIAQNLSSAFTYEPKTRAGQENLQAIANSPLAEFLGRLPPVMPMTGATGVLTKALPAMEAKGAVKALGEAPLATAEKPRVRVVAGEPMPEFVQPAKSQADPFLATDSAKQAKIRKAIEEKTVDAAGYRLEGDKVVSDSTQTDLLKKGLPEKTVVRIAQSKGDQNKAILDMLDKTERFVIGAKGSADDLPETVIGERVAKRFDTLREDLGRSAIKIRKAVRDELANKPVDVSGEVETFISSLEDLGVKDVNGRLDFSKSTIVGDTTRKKLREVYKLIDKGYASADKLHEIKQGIASHIDFQNPLAGSPDVKGEAILRDLHGSINNKLRSMSKSYEAANKEYSLSADAMGDLVGAFNAEKGAEFKKRLEQGRLPQDFGLAARKMITNYKSSVDIKEALKKANDRANQLGVNYGDDIQELVQLNDDIQNAVGRFKSGSQAGIVETGAGLAADAIGGPKVAAARRVGTAIKDKFVTPRRSKEQLEIINKMRELAAKNRGEK